MLSSAALFSGCVSAPTKPVEDKAAEGIYFVENQSVDLSVRQEFDSAVKLLHEERYEEAVVLLNKVIQASHNNTAPYINIAIAYSYLGDQASAEKYLKQAMEINPMHPAAANELAMLYRKTGRYSEARQLYDQLLQRYPEFMPARRNLGILCDLYLRDIPCAQEQYSVYSNAYPDDEEVKLWMSTLN